MKKLNNKVVYKTSRMLPMNLQLFAEEKPRGAEPNNELLGAVRQMQGQLQQLSTPQKTADQVQAEQEALIEEFNSNPEAVLNRFTQQAQNQAMQGVTPLIEELKGKIQSVEWSDAVRKFAGSNPNAKAYSQQMNEILRTNPMLADIAKKDPQQALSLSLSQAMTQSLAPNGNIVEGIAGNDEILNQILSNPDVKQKVINEYLATLNGTGGVPPLAGNSTQGSTVAPTPTGKPTSIKDAQQGALAFINASNQAKMQ